MRMQKTMRVFMMFLAVSGTTLVAGAETDHELATRLVTRYQEQISSAGAVTFQFTHEGTGKLSAAFPRTRGDVTVVPSRSGTGLFEKARISATMGNGDASREIEVSADGEIVRSLDAVNQRVLIAPTWRNGVDLVNFQYLMPVVLVRELGRLEPDEIRYEGEKTAGGTNCVVVRADTQMADLTLLFGKDDALLYGGVARKPKVWGDATIVMTFDQMKAVESIPDAKFSLRTPEGFSEVQFSGNFPTIGENAPKFSLAGFDGSPVSLDQLEGRVVVLDFWATWCAPCKEAMPGLQRLHEKYASDGLAVIGANYQERGDARAFLDRHGFTYTFASAEGSDVAETYKPDLPMVVVIDRQGRLVEIFVGYFGPESDERLERVIRGLL